MIKGSLAVSMPGKNVFFLIAALQVTAETHGSRKHGCGHFISLGPNLSPMSPETPTSFWITAESNKYRLQGRRQKRINNLVCQLCQTDLRLIVPPSA